LAGDGYSREVADQYRDEDLTEAFNTSVRAMQFHCPHRVQLKVEVEGGV
jgi:hypothetical protein